MIRKFAAIALMVGWSTSLAPGVGAVEIGDDGLRKQDWFAITFRDIVEDVDTAREEGRRFAMIF